MIDVALGRSRTGLSLTYSDLTVKQQTYVDWVAGAGTMVDDDGQIVTVTGETLASSLGVSRQALQKYRRLNGFWEIVAARRMQLYGRERMNMLYKAVWAKGLKGDTQAAKLMMQQARVLEAERQDVTHSGTVGVAVINYSDVVASESPSVVMDTHPVKGNAGREKAQLEQVPVPERIRLHPQQSLPESSNAGLPLEPSNSESPNGGMRLGDQPNLPDSPLAAARVVPVKGTAALKRDEVAATAKRKETLEKKRAASLLQAEAQKLRDEQAEALQARRGLDIQGGDDSLIPTSS